MHIDAELWLLEHFEKSDTRTVICRFCGNPEKQHIIAHDLRKFLVFKVV